MYDLAQNLSVQSYCFRHFKPIPDLIAQVKALGLNRTELCAIHVDFNDEASHPAIIDQFRTAGIQITSIGVQTFRGEPHEEKWFAFAKAAGARLISTTFDLSKLPGVLDATVKLADKYDLRLGIHNHGGYDWLGNSTMLGHLLANLSPRVGLCLDTAWCLQAGENPVAWAEKYHDRLYATHLKDFIFDRAARWNDVIVGTGNLNLPAFLKLALAAPSMTAVTLEYEGDITNPTPALRQCVDAVRKAAAH
jgi:sugar phosphate isomerase/epimerase